MYKTFIKTNSWYMKISELITLLEQDKERLWDLPIHYVDFSDSPMFDWESYEWEYKLQ